MCFQLYTTNISDIVFLHRAKILFRVYVENGIVFDFVSFGNLHEFSLIEMIYNRTKLIVFRENLKSLPLHQIKLDSHSWCMCLFCFELKDLNVPRCRHRNSVGFNFFGNVSEPLNHRTTVGGTLSIYYDICIYTHIYT